MVLLIFWALYFAAAFSPLRFVVYLFYSGLAFGSLSVVPLEMSGGITILPAIVIAPLLIFKILIKEENSLVLIDAVVNNRRLGILTLFVITSLLVTATAPGIFSGIKIMGLNTARMAPLGYGAGNITQTVYLLTSFLVTVAGYLLVVSRPGRIILVDALTLGGFVAIASGICDLLTAGTTILAPLRTASYALIIGAEIGGQHRVIGFNTEASAYGQLTLSLAAVFIFVRPNRLVGGRRELLDLCLGFGLLLFALLSTSSGAYVGSAVLLILWAFDLLRRLLTVGTTSARRAVALDAATFGLLIATAAIVAILRYDLVESLMAMIDTVVLQKKSSDSFIERSSWNQVSFDALLQTGGYGIGVGSTRASSWPVAVLSCTGILGAVLMLAFIGRFLLSAPGADETTATSAAIGARFALVVSLIPAFGAGTSVDFGMFNATLFALMAGLSLVTRPPLWFSQFQDKQDKLQTVRHYTAALVGPPQLRKNSGSLWTK